MGPLPCAGRPDVFFPEGPDIADKLTEAVDTCASCPHRERCLTAALDREEPEGVWGGEPFRNGRPVTAAEYARCALVTTAIDDLDDRAEQSLARALYGLDGPALTIGECAELIGGHYETARRHTAAIRRHVVARTGFDAPALGNRRPPTSDRERLVRAISRLPAADRGLARAVLGADGPPVPVVDYQRATGEGYDAVRGRARRVRAAVAVELGHADAPVTRPDRRVLVAVISRLPAGQYELARAVYGLDGQALTVKECQTLTGLSFGLTRQAVRRVRRTVGAAVRAHAGARAA